MKGNVSNEENNNEVKVLQANTHCFLSLAPQHRIFLDKVTSFLDSLDIGQSGNRA